MKSSRLSVFVSFLFVLLPFGAWGQEQTPAPAPAESEVCEVETSSSCDPKMDIGLSFPKGMDACFETMLVDPKTGKPMKDKDGKVLKSSNCPEVVKPKVTKKPKAKKPATSQPTSVPATQPSKPAPTKDTFTIEVTREEWEALLAKVNGLTPGDPNYVTVITEIRNRLGLFESGLAVEATSRDKEIRELQIVVNNIDAQIKGLQKQIDDEVTARKAADKKLADADAELWDANAKLWKAFNAFRVDGDATLGHVLAGEYFGGFLFAGGQSVKKSDFMGLSLRVALNERVGIHGGVAADLNLLRRVPAAGGATALQLGLYYPDVTWNVGLDFVYNSKVVVTVDGRVVHQGLYSVGGLTVESLNPLGCAGIEASVFKRWPTSALTFSGCGGIEIDKDSPLPEFGLHIGMKHGLWVKGK